MRRNLYSRWVPLDITARSVTADAARASYRETHRERRMRKLLIGLMLLGMSAAANATYVDIEGRTWIDPPFCACNPA